MMRKALKAALPRTLPVMAGYLFTGFAFGVLFCTTGRHPALAVLMSVTVYAGSMQFFAVRFMDGSFGLLAVALLTLLINARHVFYGLPFVTKFRETGRRMPYMAFSLTDETFSLFCSVKPPEGVGGADFLFAIALLDQCYWVAGTALGVIFGSALPFNTAGISFAMTALFVVIAVEQWRDSPSKAPALAGLSISLAALLLFGGKDFILPAMGAIAGVLTLMRSPVQRRFDEADREREAAACRQQDTRLP